MADTGSYKGFAGPCAFMCDFGVIYFIVTAKKEQRPFVYEGKIYDLGYKPPKKGKKEETAEEKVVSEEACENEEEEK